MCSIWEIVAIFERDLRYLCNTLKSLVTECKNFAMKIKLNTKMWLKLAHEMLGYCRK